MKEQMPFRHEIARNGDDLYFFNWKGTPIRVRKLSDNRISMMGWSPTDMRWESLEPFIAQEILKWFKEKVKNRKEWR